MAKHAVAVVGTTLLMLLASATVAAGSAAADPDVVGKQYSEAKAALGAANLTPVVATVVGDQVKQDQCYVVSALKAPKNLDSSGGGVVRVSLSCYASPASGGASGVSAANHSPEAEAIRSTSHQQELQWKQSEDGQEWCAQAAVTHPEWGAIEGC